MDDRLDGRVLKTFEVRCVVALHAKQMVGDRAKTLHQLDVLVPASSNPYTVNPKP